MPTITALEEFVPPIQGSAVALGFFDGVHRGHLALLQRALGGPEAPVVFTFRNHPSSVVSHARLPQLLTDFSERCDLLMKAGLDVVWVDFDRPFSQLEPREFIQDILLRSLSARRVITGDNYRFGYRAAGTPALLRDCSDFTVEIVPDVLEGGQIISSSRIRAALLEGRVDEAERLLGRPFCISGRVLRGEQLGRKLGAPTANLSLNGEKVIPGYGVYAVRARHKGITHNGVANLGVRPTAQADQKVPLLEVHLLDFDGDLYGEQLQVDFVARIRGEQKFPGLDALKAQIQLDIARARQLTL